MTSSETHAQQARPQTRPELICKLPLISQQPSLGIVVIGRNEGLNLQRSLTSLKQIPRAVVIYVDSGSTDRSVDWARSRGVFVHTLSTDRPFTAARARDEGVQHLLKLHSGLKYLQFVDGDCELFSGWTTDAAHYLECRPDVSIVCGTLVERDPQASVYNYLNSLQWRQPTGKIEACGGLFLIRKHAYCKAGGFNRDLLTMEEQDLCARIRQHGGTIVRLERPMARHDSGLLTFKQWWNRAVWGGHGAARQWQHARHKGEAGYLALLKTYYLWPVAIPLTGLVGLSTGWLYNGMLTLFFASLLAAILLFLRLWTSRRRQQDSRKDAALYAGLQMFRKLPVCIGVSRYLLFNRNAIVPDPHAGRGPSDRQANETPSNTRNNQSSPAGSAT